MSNKKAQALYEDVLAYLETLRTEARKAAEDGQYSYQDPIADTKVVLGSVDYAYTSNEGRNVHSNSSESAVSLTFDGAGFDLFSYDAEHFDLSEFGHEGWLDPSAKQRKALEDIAKRHGYRMEDITIWAIGFYKD